MNTNKYKAALIGIAGYIAPRHLIAMKANNIDLKYSYDISDSVGIIDNYYPAAKFTTDYNKFKKDISSDIDFLIICSPNYLHKKHIIDGLKCGLDIICEKPTVINIKDLNAIEKAEEKYQGKIYTIMQLRYHPEIIKLNKYIKKKKKKNFEVELTYITSRGNWFYNSWKGDKVKSGGIVFNIGIHLFDILIYLFGYVKKIEINRMNKKVAEGYIEFKNARVKWLLSTDLTLLKKDKVNRTIKIDNRNYNFSKGFESLHNISYSKIISSKGFKIKDIKGSIELCEKIYRSTISKKKLYNL